MFSDTEDVMGAAGVSKSVVDVVLARAVAAAAAILEAASWLYDLIIVRPLGPTLGVIFLAEGRGGVPVALTVPEFFFSDCSSDDDDSLLDSLDSCFGKWRLGLCKLVEERPETLAAEDPVAKRSLEGSTDNRSLN